ncbi:MAG: signal peptidase I [Sphingomonadales bacterium 32-68-7]|nr:MAG: signal peptidase I [Sphingomonadales bacterium 12-68-11]OYX08514.1 MAG: signal peptidase I [Sphingomonadales bacterium 32-68-7]
MTDVIAPVSETAETAPAEKKPKEEGSFLWFLVKLAIAVFVFRTFIFTSFMIPSESMMPRLLVGDYLFAAKWPYGYSRASLPLDIDIGDGRLFGGLPERGDVVIFKHPIDRTDYVKRVVGLPGDQVQMVAGVLHLNGQPVTKAKISDLLLPIEPTGRCAQARFTERQADGSFACRYPRYRETLPGGRSYEVLDFGLQVQDTTPPVLVPQGRLFLMGDNRDNSMDSRYPPVSNEGVGLVPVENLAGRASFMFLSLDDSVRWYNPISWFTGMRWSRIGGTF